MFAVTPDVGAGDLNSGLHPCTLCILLTDSPSALSPRPCPLSPHLFICNLTFYVIRYHQDSEVEKTLSFNTGEDKNQEIL